MLTFTFTEGAATKPFEQFVEQEMLKSLQHFDKELGKLRTGRAHTSMIEDIRVIAYGTSMPLKECAAIAAPEPQLLTVQPWDKGLMQEIEKALATSDLGITPLNDGSLIRLPLPKLSAGLREDLAKVVAKRLEECKVSIRTVRKDVLELIRATEKGKKVSEDYSKRLQTLLQKITDDMSDKADQAASRKTAEIKTL